MVCDAPGGARGADGGAAAAAAAAAAANGAAAAAAASAALGATHGDPCERACDLIRAKGPQLVQADAGGCATARPAIAALSQARVCAIRRRQQDAAQVSRAAKHGRRRRSGWAAPLRSTGPLQRHRFSSQGGNASVGAV